MKPKEKEESEKVTSAWKGKISTYKVGQICHNIPPGGVFVLKALIDAENERFD